MRSAPSSPEEERLYRKYLLLLAAAAAAIAVLARIPIGADKPNFINPNTSSLDHHALSLHGKTAPRPILLLGSTEVSGALAPDDSYVADFLNRIIGRRVAYNLTGYNSELLDSLAFFQLALRHRPAVAILQVWPWAFEPVVRGSWVVSRHPELLGELEKFAVSDGLKARFRASFERQYPTAYSYRLARWMIRARRAVFGDILFLGHYGGYWRVNPHARTKAIVARFESEAQARALILRRFQRVAREHGVKFFVVIAPMISRPGDDFPDIEASRLELIEALKAEGVAWFDYMHLLDSRPALLADGVFPLPEARAILADQIYRDMISQAPARR